MAFLNFKNINIFLGKLGKYAEVAFNLERLFSGRPRKSSSQGSDDSKDPSKKKRISFEDFLRQKVKKQIFFPRI